MTCKRKAWIVLLALIISNSIFSSALLASDRQGTLEFIIGNYGMNEPRFKAAYQEAGVIRGMALSCQLIYDFDFYLEIRYLNKLGLLTYTKEETKLQLLPISLGIRYVRPMGWAYPYLGVGPDFYLYYETNPIGTVFNSAKGFHFQGGSYFQFLKKLPLWLNLKLKYTKVKTEENNRKIELGGFEYEAGFVIVF